MNIERLQALSARLRHVPPDRFSLKGFESRGRRCTACVAAYMPEFNLLGYCMDIDDAMPRLGSMTGFDAFEEFFGLGRYDHWERIVSPNADAPPSVIADRIDAMIAAQLRAARLLPVVVPRESVSV